MSRTYWCGRNKALTGPDGPLLLWLYVLRGGAWLWSSSVRSHKYVQRRLCSYCWAGQTQRPSAGTGYRHHWRLNGWHRHLPRCHWLLELWIDRQLGRHSGLPRRHCLWVDGHRQLLRHQCWLNRCLATAAAAYLSYHTILLRVNSDKAFLSKQENLGGSAFTVSHNVPRSQHPNKNVFSSRLNRWKLMSACRISWKAVPQLQTCSCKTPVSTVAVCSPHNTRPWCGRAQLTTTFVGDQLAVGGQIGWSHARHWQVDQILWWSNVMSYISNATKVTETSLRILLTTESKYWPLSSKQRWKTDLCQ